MNQQNRDSREDDAVPLGASFGVNFVTYSEYLLLKKDHDKIQVILNKILVLKEALSSIF